jgi:hypothetical protein
LFVFTDPYGLGMPGGQAGRSVGRVGRSGRLGDRAGRRSVGWADEALSQYRHCDEIEAIGVGGTGMGILG